MKILRTAALLLTCILFCFSSLSCGKKKVDELLTTDSWVFVMVSENGEDYFAPTKLDINEYPYIFGIAYCFYDGEYMAYEGFTIDGEIYSTSKSSGTYTIDNGKIDLVPHLAHYSDNDFEYTCKRGNLELFTTGEDRQELFRIKESQIMKK